MKNLLVGLFIVAVTLTATAQDKMMTNEAIKTVSLEQIKGEFIQKSITLKEGTYIFEVSNNNAAPEVGLVLIEDGRTVMMLKTILKKHTYLKW
jgi:hypothetical protein